MLKRKPGRLLLAQVDHVSGEVIGFAVDEIMARGARNVQVISTITKKNRPGSLLLIDIAPDLEDTMGSFLAHELGVSGYHIIDTEHAYNEVSFVERHVAISHEGSRLGAICLVKVVGPLDAPLSLKAEHADLVKLKEVVAEQFGHDLALEDLRHLVEHGVRRNGSEKVVIEL